MAKVKTYVVTHPKGVDLGPGHFDLGDTVFHPWVDEPTGLGVGRLISMGYVAHTGEVDEDAVPEVATDETESVEEAPAIPTETPPEGGTLEERMASAMVYARAEAQTRAEADAAHNADVHAAAYPEHPDTVGDEVRAGVAAIAEAGADGLPDERIADADLAGYVETSTIPVIVAYATANPDQTDALIGVEKRGKARTTLLTALGALNPAGA